MPGNERQIALQSTFLATKTAFYIAMRPVYPRKIEKFYDFINYLEDIKVNIELIECFNKIVVGGNNINPCNYLDTLTPKQVAGARRLYKKK